MKALWPSCTQGPSAVCAVWGSHHGSLTCMGTIWTGTIGRTTMERFQARKSPTAAGIMASGWARAHTHTCLQLELTQISTIKDDIWRYGTPSVKLSSVLLERLVCLYIVQTIVFLSPLGLDRVWGDRWPGGASQKSVLWEREWGWGSEESGCS